MVKSSGKWCGAWRDVLDLFRQKVLKPFLPSPMFGFRNNWVMCRPKFKLLHVAWGQDQEERNTVQMIVRQE